jgi:hypothetical protein
MDLPILTKYVALMNNASILQNEIDLFVQMTKFLLNLGPAIVADFKQKTKDLIKNELNTIGLTNADSINFQHLKNQTNFQSIESVRKTYKILIQNEAIFYILNPFIQNDLYKKNQ